MPGSEPRVDGRGARSLIPSCQASHVCWRPGIIIMGRPCQRVLPALCFAMTPPPGCAAATRQLANRLSMWAAASSRALSSAWRRRYALVGRLPAGSGVWWLVGWVHGHRRPSVAVHSAIGEWIRRGQLPREPPPGQRASAGLTAEAHQFPARDWSLPQSGYVLGTSHSSRVGREAARRACERAEGGTRRRPELEPRAKRREAKKKRLRASCGVKPCHASM